MKNLHRRIIWFGAIILMVAMAIGFSPQNATANEYHLPFKHPEWMVNDLAKENQNTFSALGSTELPPPAEQNPCLHCHIAGQIESEWSPISRWLVFGAMVFTFIFGISRNFIVWKIRERWHQPWIEQFSGITAIFFILQVITGIILGIFTKATSEIVLQIMAIIKAIHWGSGIILFITALGLSFAGALRPWYQRPIWAMIFITGIIGSALAIAKLSFAYLYAEWHIPPSPSRLYAFHMLLIPLAFAGILSIFFSLRKRGETS